MMWRICGEIISTLEYQKAVNMTLTMSSGATPHSAPMFSLMVTGVVIR